MEQQIAIYQDAEGIQIEVHLEDDTIWLTQAQIVDLFQSSKANISEHIKHIFESGELEEQATVRKFRTVQQEGTRHVSRNRLHYNLDVIISVGYRVNSKRGTQFRIWANRVLTDYLIQGYTINQKRLVEKKEEIQILKDGIAILGRVIEEKSSLTDNAWLEDFAKGLTLLDDYDHESLDKKGLSQKDAIYPAIEEYEQLVSQMRAEFDSNVFALEKDQSFKSSLVQIEKGFGEHDFYPSLEEKAATLLYLVTKNHSFVDGNKRIAAACFLKFLEANEMLKNKSKEPIISSDTLASLTLFVASTVSQKKWKR